MPRRADKEKGVEKVPDTKEATGSSTKFANGCEDEFEADSTVTENQSEGISTRGKQSKKILDIKAGSNALKLDIPNEANINKAAAKGRKQGKKVPTKEVEIQKMPDNNGTKHNSLEDNIDLNPSTVEKGEDLKTENIAFAKKGRKNRKVPAKEVEMSKMSDCDKKENILEENVVQNPSTDEKIEDEETKITVSTKKERKNRKVPIKEDEMSGNCVTNVDLNPSSEEKDVDPETETNTVYNKKKNTNKRGKIVSAAIANSASNHLVQSSKLRQKGASCATFILSEKEELCDQDVGVKDKEAEDQMEVNVDSKKPNRTRNTKKGNTNDIQNDKIAPVNADEDIHISSTQEQPEVITLPPANLAKPSRTRKRKNVNELEPELTVKSKPSSSKKEGSYGVFKELKVVIKRLDPLLVEELMESKEKTKAAAGSKGKASKRAKDKNQEDAKEEKAAKVPKKTEKSSSQKEKIPDVSLLDFTNASKSSSGKEWNLKISSWNVNGIRAWLEKDGISFLHQEKPDIMCVQETKCSDEKLPENIKKVEGYHTFWLAGDKDGYSGVGILTKEKPKSVKYGIGIEEHDNEGRVITSEYEHFYLVAAYVPNAGRGLVRLEYRQNWDKDFLTYLSELDKKKPVILCGDLNVAHQEIDLANPKTNKKNAGFTKEEREGFSTLLEAGFIDSFRLLYPDVKGAYTFWTYMMNARKKNVGWRLDYFVVSKRLQENICDNVIRKDVEGSDHCPITLFLSL